jgi:hypothetical protein
MRVLKILMFKLCLLLPVIAFTQEGAILMPLTQDSAQIELERQIEYQQLISGQFSNELVLEQMQLPDFDFTSEFARRYSINYDAMSMSSLPLSDFTLGLFTPFYSPYTMNSTVLSQAAYKVNDRFIFGGFSYGSNFLPTLPPAPGINNFNRYGSTMFMQYKVGKNFKIETRVNVSQGGMHPGY